jgi:hypothetical protein
MLRYSLLALLCFVSSLAGSLVTVAVMRPAPHEPPAPAKDESLLVAKALVLTDDSGAIRVRLQGDPAAPGLDGGLLVFYDGAGVPRLRAGLDTKGGPFVTLQNTELPNPDHKRITLAVTNDTARADIGHGQLSEIVFQSTPQGEPPSSVVSVLGRDGSEASLYTDPFGHATIEVKDLTTTSIFRQPELRPVLP